MKKWTQRNYQAWMNQNFWRDYSIPLLVYTVRRADVCRAGGVERDCMREQLIAEAWGLA